MPPTATEMVLLWLTSMLPDRANQFGPVIEKVAVFSESIGASWRSAITIPMSAPLPRSGGTQAPAVRRRSADRIAGWYRYVFIRSHLIYGKGRRNSLGQARDVRKATSA